MSANAAIFNPTESTSAATGDGFSCPRLTTTGRLAISFGVNDKGMMVFDTTLNNLFIWNGTAWESVPGSGDSSDTQVIFNDNGNLAGDPGLLYQKSLQRLTVGTNVDIWRGGLNDGTSTAVGSRTLETTAAGATGNTAIGYRAMYRALTASENVAVGVNALSANFFTGIGNVAVGNGALQSATVSDLTAVGTSALALNTTGTNNTAVGRSALAANLTGLQCTAVGMNALAGLQTGTGNTAFGFQAINTGTGGSNNVAVGVSALLAGGGGNNSTAVGNNALLASTNGANTALGSGAGANITTGINNICIGVSASASAAGISNELSIGSSGNFVATNGAAATYFATATAGAVVPGNCQGFIRILLNGTFVKIPVYGN